MVRGPKVGLAVALVLALHSWPQLARAQSESILSMLPTEGRSLAVGDEVSGALSASDIRGPDDAPLEAWALEGRSGERVTLDLASADFDAYLYLVGPGFEETQRDDDSGGGCNARLNVTLLEAGTFVVVASSLSGETGPYTLSVSTEPGPVAPYACGDVNPAALLDLPTEGRALARGETEFGRFDGTEPTIQDGRPAEAWSYEAFEGERVTFRLLSDDFDAYLHVAGPGLPEALSDDDGAGELNSEITADFPVAGSYLVVASALSAGSTGSYRVEVRDPIDLGELPTEGRGAVIGETVTGFLSDTAPRLVDGRPGQAWSLDGSAGQALTIELRSDDFDAYLYLAGPGLDSPLENDDGGGGTDSRIEVSLPESGSYRLIVSAFSSGSTGDFELRVTPD